MGFAREGIAPGPPDPQVASGMLGGVDRRG
jgi:hypothetical protein